MSSYLYRRTIITATFLGVLSSSFSAHADTVILSNFWSVDNRIGIDYYNVTDTATGATSNALASPMTYAWVNTGIYGTAYRTQAVNWDTPESGEYQAASANSVFNANQTSALTALFNKSFTNLPSGLYATAAAYEISIWAILYGNPAQTSLSLSPYYTVKPDAPYYAEYASNNFATLSSGAFSITNIGARDLPKLGTSDLLAAEEMLNNLNTNKYLTENNYSITVLTNAQNQQLITTTPVPETTTIALLLAGLTTLGWAGRRQNFGKQPHRFSPSGV